MRHLKSLFVCSILLLPVPSSAAEQGTHLVYQRITFESPKTWFFGLIEEVWQEDNKGIRHTQFTDPTRPPLAITVWRGSQAWRKDADTDSWKSIDVPEYYQELKLPVLQPPSLNSAVLNQLEFGQEIAFFKRHGKLVNNDLAFLGRRCALYTFTDGFTKLDFYISNVDKVPYYLHIWTMAKQTAILYLTHETNAPLPANTFVTE